MKDAMNKAVQRVELSGEDKLELKAIERRFNMLVTPLKQCIVASQKLDSVARLSLNHAKELVEEFLKFLSSLSSDIAYKMGGNFERNAVGILSTQIQYFRQELDFAVINVLTTLAVHNSALDTMDSSAHNVSLSSLLKASQRISSMTSITGKIYSVKGRFFILSKRIAGDKRNTCNVFDEIDWEEEKSPAAEEPEDSPKLEQSAGVWRKEESLAKLVVSLNLVLNIYVLQVFVEKMPKYNFYINHELNFQCREVAELGIEELTDNKLAYNWKSVINADTEYELIVPLYVEGVEHKAGRVRG